MTAKAPARMSFVEAEGAALIPTAQFPCLMITLNIRSSLEVVGFMAGITAHLAKRPMGVNPVPGFFHDHLFTDGDRAEDAMAALRGMSAGARAGERRLRPAS